MKEIYLDNSATTPCDLEVAQYMLEVMTTYYGNPSALHQKGLEAERLLKKAKEKIGKVLQVTEEIYFTSGGTESNNMAIQGICDSYQRRGKHIITTAGEHSSVLSVYEHLHQKGYEVTYIPLDKYGDLDVDALFDALREDTILVSVMWVNNEVGNIYPIEKIGKYIKEYYPQTIFHIDGVQGVGRLRIHPQKVGVDLLTASAHKFYGPKGVGFLYKNPKIKCSPLLLGGGQQKNQRSGTENVAGIIGMAMALEKITNHQGLLQEHFYQLSTYLRGGLAKIPQVKLYRKDGQGVDYIVQCSITGVRGEVLLHALEEKGIYISTGAACATHKKGVSSTLASMGLTSQEIQGSIRISLGKDTSLEDIDIFLEELKKSIVLLEKFQAK